MITNSDLELASAIAHQDILLQESNCAGCTIMPFTNNTLTLAWQHKGSTSTSGLAAYLLHVASLHQQHYRYLAKPDFIKGNVNDMADDCSQLWHLTDSQLLAYFNCTYPQMLPWKLVTLQPAMHSALISSTLQKQRLLLQLFLGERARTKDGHWCIWEMFIANFMGIDPYLTTLPLTVKLHFLQVAICNMTTMRTHCTRRSPYPILASGRLHMDRW